MIRWTSREWRSIAELLVRRAVIPSDRGWRTAVLDAMKTALPCDRWRTADCLNNSKTILVPLMKELAQNQESKHTAAVPQHAQMPSLKDFTIEQMVAEIVSRAVCEVTSQIQKQAALAAQQSASAHHRKHDPFCAQNERAHLKKVLVVGPRNGQQTELERAHEPFLDLRFVSSDEAPSRLDAYRNTDHVVLWTNYISHAHQAHAQALNAQLHYVTGGMSALHNQLRKIS